MLIKRLLLPDVSASYIIKIKAASWSMEQSMEQPSKVKILKKEKRRKKRGGKKGVGGWGGGGNGGGSKGNYSKWDLQFKNGLCTYVFL